jgi:hypothetical protein
MAPRSLTKVLAAYDVRRRITRGADGTIHLCWGPMSVGMGQGEFVDFAGLVTEAAECAARCGELARGCRGRVFRCSMGQIMLTHGTLTLWFSPEEFEELCRLAARARQRLADAEPLPALGVAWHPRHHPFCTN